MSVPYDDWYYKEQYGNAFPAAMKVLPRLFEVIGVPESLVDLGCGSGAWCDAAIEYGVRRVVGLDGPWIEARTRFSSGWDLKVCDLRDDSPAIMERFDVALCLEVVEHVDRAHEAKIFKMLDDLSDTVLFSGAVLGQGGLNHVNEQPRSHWDSQMRRMGYSVAAFDVPRDIPFWYRDNIGLWVRT